MVWPGFRGFCGFGLGGFRVYEKRFVGSIGLIRFTVNPEPGHWGLWGSEGL